MKTIQILQCFHGEARRLLATGSPVYLCINPVEFHGPHLSLHNDTLVATGLCRDMHRRLLEQHPEWPFCKAPDLVMGTGTVPGPGSRDVPLPQLRAAVQDACRALADLGARRVVLMSFHGAPLHNVAVQAGVDLLTARGVQAIAPMPLLIQKLMQGDALKAGPLLRFIEDPVQRQEVAQSLSHDIHAGFLETSLSLHYAPESVNPDYGQLPPSPQVKLSGPLSSMAAVARALGLGSLATDLDYVAHGLPWIQQRPHPGYAGRPHLARGSVGAELARLITEQYATAAEEVFAGRAASPRPPLGWLGPITLGGRLIQALSRQ